MTAKPKSPSELSAIAQVLVSPVLDGISEQETYAAVSRAVDPNGRFIFEGREYHGQQGVLDYRRDFHERFSGVAVRISSVTHIEDQGPSSLLQEYHIGFDVEAMRRSNSRIVPMNGLAVVHLQPSVGIIAKGFVTLSWQAGIGSDPKKQLQEDEQASGVSFAKSISCPEIPSRGSRLNL